MCKYCQGCKSQVDEPIHCINVTYLPPVAHGVKIVNLSDCVNLRILPEMHIGVVSIDISGCRNIKELIHLPKMLTSLNYSGSGVIHVELPAGLKDLNCSSCAIPTLPDNLTKLICRYSTGQFSKFPKTLRVMDCIGWASDTEKIITGFPSNLQLLIKDDRVSTEFLPYSTVVSYASNARYVSY